MVPIRPVLNNLSLLYPFIASPSKPGVLNLSTIDTEGQFILCCGRLFCALQNAEQYPYLLSQVPGTTFPCKRMHLFVLRCASVTPWTARLLSVGFLSKNTGFPSPEDLPHPGIKPVSHYVPCIAGGFFTTRTSWKVSGIICFNLKINY